MSKIIAVVAAVLALVTSVAMGQQTAEEQFDAQVKAALVSTGVQRISALQAAISSGLAHGDRLASAERTLVSEQVLLSDWGNAYVTVRNSLANNTTQSDGSRERMLRDGFNVVRNFETSEQRVGARIELGTLYLNTCRQINLGALADILKPYLPHGDAAYIFLNDTAQGLVDAEVRLMRQDTGRIDRARVQAVSDRVIRNQGPLLYRSDDPITQQIAAGIVGNAPNAEFSRLLIGAQYAAAAQFAYGQAVNAENEDMYNYWMRMAARVVRTKDQCYNGRVQLFFKWVNGELADNPVPDLITE